MLEVRLGAPCFLRLVPRKFGQSVAIFEGCFPRPRMASFLTGYMTRKNDAFRPENDPRASLLNL
jgi:hypothetical protein